jgi:hypothetical protein
MYCRQTVTTAKVMNFPDIVAGNSFLVVAVLTSAEIGIFVEALLPCPPKKMPPTAAFEKR